MKILLAIDGSTASEAAVEAVKMQAWPAGSTIRVLSVAEPVYPPPPPPAGMVMGAYPYPSTSLSSLNDHIMEEADRLAQRTADALRSTRCEVQADAVSGDPRDTIVELAREWAADLIVLGSHGRTGLRRWLLGSVAESVVRHAPCSVEVARAKAPAAAQ